MGLFFLFVFILWGWAEMSTFIFIGGEIGGLLTLLGVFVTAGIGLSLLKNQGRVVIAQVRTDLAQGRAPVETITDSIALAVGGIFMLIPGYITDVIGISLFVPGFRTFAGASILHHLINNERFAGFVHVGRQNSFTSHTDQSFGENNDVIEGDVTEHPKNQLNKD